MTETATVLDKVLAVFDAIGDWFANAVENLIPMFYTNGELTFVGILAVAGLGISVIMLILNTIKDYLHFR